MRMETADSRPAELRSRTSSSTTDATTLRPRRRVRSTSGTPALALQHPARRRASASGHRSRAICRDRLPGACAGTGVRVCPVPSSATAAPGSQFLRGACSGSADCVLAINAALGHGDVRAVRVPAPREGARARSCVSDSVPGHCASRLGYGAARTLVRPPEGLRLRGVVRGVSRPRSCVVSEDEPRSATSQPIGPGSMGRPSAEPDPARERPARHVELATGSRQLATSDVTGARPSTCRSRRRATPRRDLPAWLVRRRRRRGSSRAFQASSSRSRW